jgi:cell division protein FtsW
VAIPYFPNYGSESAESVKRPSLVVRWLSHPQASFYLVLVPALLLLGLGVIMVQSASSVYAKHQFHDSYYFLKRQLIFLVIGVLVAWVLIRLKVQMMRAMGWVFLVLAFIFQLLTFSPLGWGKNGNTNWVELGSPLLRFQPSELVKLALVVWAADVLDRKYKLLRQPKHIVFPFIFVAVVLIGLVVVQADLGTGVILGGIMIAILWFIGVRWKVLASVFAVIGVSVLTLIAISPNRMGRILGFFDQSSDPLGANHQPIKAMFALATGGWWGVGLGSSKQKWGGLVEAHNDYVLAVIGEELGLVTVLLILGLFMILGYAGFRIAMRSDNNFIRFMSAGITSWFMIQALTNVLVVLRLIPVIGVPLPFVSYGGSALLSNICGVALLLACARMEPAAREYVPDDVDAPVSKSFLAFANDLR